MPPKAKIIIAIMGIAALVAVLDTAALAMAVVTGTSAWIAVVGTVTAAGISAATVLGVAWIGHHR
ncbi:hypothetical protein EOT10_40165 [Streptomyces antnestii]|uniref:Uncharacterized protein n=1 Tax=Streptomyces antnestii TaxID=2494256 RepID=A0A437NXQ7_9ACTN|nr:hypothetical protein [Streptomyces sp. San01]RVU14809.1 hypothetical protein EOT10_40165 [Streptomyces sp. San01]